MHPQAHRCIAKDSYVGNRNADAKLLAVKIHNVVDKSRIRFRDPVHPVGALIDGRPSGKHCPTGKHENPGTIFDKVELAGTQ